MGIKKKKNNYSLMVKLSFTLSIFEINQFISLRHKSKIYHYNILKKIKKYHFVNRYLILINHIFIIYYIFCSFLHNVKY